MAPGTSQPRHAIRRAFVSETGIVDRVELVDGEHDVRHPQQVCQQGMPAGLRQQRDDVGRNVDLRDVDQHHGGVTAGRCSDHVAGVLLVAGRVCDDELARAGREIAVGHVDRDALLAFGLEAVGQQRQVDRRARGAFFEQIQLVSQDRAAVEQQTADQRALAIVDAACGQKTQGAVVGVSSRGR